jgi:hypothetical protein
VILVVTMIVEGLSLWGTWLLTSPEPRLELHEQPVTLRKVIRLCAVLGFGGGLLTQAEGLATGNTAMLFAVLGGMLALAGIVELIGQLIYLRRLARRVPDPALEKSTSVVLWGLPISTGVLLLAALVFALAAALTPAGGGALAVAGAGFTAVGCVLGAGILLFSIWYVVLLFQYRSAFKIAERQARVNWDPAVRRP